MYATSSIYQLNTRYITATTTANTLIPDTMDTIDVTLQIDGTNIYHYRGRRLVGIGMAVDDRVFGHRMYTLCLDEGIVMVGTKTMLEYWLGDPAWSVGLGRQMGRQTDHSIYLGDIRES